MLLDAGRGAAALWAARFPIFALVDTQDTPVCFSPRPIALVLAPKRVATLGFTLAGLAPKLLMWLFYDVRLSLRRFYFIGVAARLSLALRSLPASPPRLLPNSLRNKRKNPPA